MPVGLSIGPLLRLARQSSGPLEPAGPLVVLGPLAPQLSRALAEGGDASLVRPDGEPAGAGVLVCVLAGGPSAEQLRVLRAAARAGTPRVAVQTGAPADVPYVLARDVVDCPPGRGFPVERIAGAIARAAGPAGAALAARLPALREPVVRALVARSALRAAAIAAVPWVHGSHLPLLLPLQARTIREALTATGAPERELPLPAAAPVRPEFGLALAVGLAGRSLARALPHGGVPVRAAIAGGVTLAIGALAATPGLLTQRHS
ncbi:MAG: hypothetical protein OEV72_03420 [Thermoleophilia bacterium]|nr:hypothetical protein [Thermoleophilia bacterium]